MKLVDYCQYKVLEITLLFLYVIFVLNCFVYLDGVLYATGVILKKTILVFFIN